MAIDQRAREYPDRPAIVMSDGSEMLTFAQLDDRSAKLAGALRNGIAQPGDRIAMLMDNCADCLVLAWACRRAGLRLVPINWHLVSAEMRYVIEDSDSVAVIARPQLAREHSFAGSNARLLVTGSDTVGHYEPLEPLIAAAAPIAPEDQREGAIMFYSSGTTGKPKGILRPLSEEPFGTPNAVESVLMPALFRFQPGQSVYLSPAPLYHAAPLAYCVAALFLGGTVVIMPQFEPEGVLQAIERHRVTHAQFVPTHFVRMLRLPEEVRAAHDLSSLQCAIHAAAPCPPKVKREMIEWWGPIIEEYYAGSEGVGFTYIGSSDWLAHPGSVGRSPVDPIHVLDEDGQPVPTGEIGMVYFEGSVPFSYHKAPEKTQGSYSPQGYASIGDMGYLDEDGFLYLADRKSHMIISGGVNIYPQEIEHALAEHAAVADIAVIGVPNEDLGEEVKAIVELRPGHSGDDAMADALMAFAAERLARFKLPRSFAFVDELPRLPNGKLLKRQLRDDYWKETA